MPGTCSVCKSKWRSEIERQLIHCEAYRSIAKQYGCSEPAVFRHKNGHLPKKLALAKQHEETLSSERLLEEMADLKARLLRGLEQAERANSAAALVAFAREVQQCLESYFSIADRIAERKLVQAVADAGGLGERIAAARKRLAEVRERVVEDNKSQAGEPSPLEGMP